MKIVRVKKRIRLVGLVMTIFAVLFSTHAYSQQKELSGKIEVWSWEIAAEHLQRAIPGFNKKYPKVKVTVKDFGRVQVYDKVTIGLETGGYGLPDAYSLEMERLPGYVEKFADYFTDLSQFGANKLESDYSKYAWNLCVFDGKVSALPWDIGPALLYYRRDILEKAGVDINGIADWEEFLQAGKKVPIATDGKTKMCTKDFSMEMGYDYLNMLSMQQGVFYFTRDGKINVAAPEFARILKWEKSMYDADLFHPISSWSERVSASKTGAVATCVLGIWWAGTIYHQAPELSGKWGVRKLPAFVLGQNVDTNYGGSCLLVNELSKNKEAAYKFIEYDATALENWGVALQEYCLFPAYKPVYNHPLFRKPSEYFSNQYPYLIAAEETAHIPLVNYTTDYARVIEMMVSMEPKVLVEDKDISEALRDVAKQIGTATDREIAD